MRKTRTHPTTSVTSSLCKYAGLTRSLTGGFQFGAGYSMASTPGVSTDLGLHLEGGLGFGDVIGGSADLTGSSWTLGTGSFHEGFGGGLWLGAGIGGYRTGTSSSLFDILANGPDITREQFEQNYRSLPGKYQ